jgi:FkbM family methyltransferase
MSYVKHGDLWYPEYDRVLHKAHGPEDLTAVWPHLTQRRCVVQAGGGVGRWAAELAKTFDHVYTFEPDPQNFACLVRNCTAPNVMKYQAALGQRHELIHLEPLEPNNAGAGEVFPGGHTPTIVLDDLALEDVDFIQLDVEGSEEKVLRGASRIIQRDGPVLLLEFGNVPRATKDSLATYLESIGYACVADVHRDKVYALSERG